MIWLDADGEGQFPRRERVSEGSARGVGEHDEDVERRERPTSSGAVDTVSYWLTNTSLFAFM